jgi:two-component system chemotaxis sensor kinase CheA
MAADAQLTQRLMSTFLVELEEHARAMERDLLLLERGDEETGPIYVSLFRSAHSLKGAARVTGLHVIETACHRVEEILQALQEGRSVADGPLFQLLLSTADALSATGRLLAEKSDAAGSPLVKLLPKLAAVGSAQSSAARVHAEPAPPAVLSPKSAAKPLDATLRIQAGKLDALLAQDGELLVARRRGAIHIETVEKLLQGARDAQREGRETQGLREITRELQGFAVQLAEDTKTLDLAAGKLSDEIRRVRMLPFTQACEGLDRLIRDLTASGDKEISLVVSGGDIGVDRSVLEGLRDPLLHLVRNAVDHGVEAKSERSKVRKPPAGSITISASLNGPQIIVKVRDDGRGIDTDAVNTAARKRGLVPSSIAGREHDIIFEAGFTTLASASSISGRGVGLDVVKSQIEAMRGAITVATDPANGTEFTLVLPLTLTSIRGLLIGCGGQTFALDSTTVRGLRRVVSGDVRVVAGRPVLVGEGDPLPLASLADLLGLDAAPPPDGEPMRVVLLGLDAPQVAIIVDALYDEDDLTVRNLGPRFGRIANFSGGTILPDGRVVLILHAGDLVAAALNGNKPSRFTQGEKPRASKKRLVIAEDSMTTRTLVKAILENAGYEVEAAEDGAQAWRLVEARGADLVVSDIEMPKMDGFALTEAIRGSARYSDIPVILLTALETDRDKARGLSAGANAYLLKSGFDQRELLAAIRQMV